MATRDSVKQNVHIDRTAFLRDSSGIDVAERQSQVSEQTQRLAQAMDEINDALPNLRTRLFPVLDETNGLAGQELSKAPDAVCALAHELRERANDLFDIAHNIRALTAQVEL
jgi:hypothetical protein